MSEKILYNQHCTHIKWKVVQMNQVLQAETMVVQQQQINVLVLVNNELLNKKLA